MTVDYNAIAIIINTFAVIVAISALLIEARRGRLVLRTDIVLKLNEQFLSPMMLAWRRRAAIKLLKKETPNNEVIQLLGFFSTIGFLYERKAIDTDLAYKEFSYWILGYWLCVEDYVREERKNDPTCWLALERIVKALMHKTVEEDSPFTKEMIQQFLQEEANLPAA